MHLHHQWRIRKCVGIPSLILYLQLCSELTSWLRHSINTMFKVAPPTKPFLPFLHSAYYCLKHLLSYLLCLLSIYDHWNTNPMRAVFLSASFTTMSQILELCLPHSRCIVNICALFESKASRSLRSNPCY